MITRPDNHRHAGPSEPSPWVRRFAPLIPRDGAVLDLACGSGRHGRYVLQRGHPVVFLDRDIGAVRDLDGRAGVEIVEADLETGRGWPFDGRRFAGIVVTNYLWRPLLATLATAVADGGALIYETFGVGNERYSRPRDPDHLLRPGELLEAFADTLQVVAYEAGIRRDPKPRVIQRLAAVNAKRPAELFPADKI